MTEKLYVTASHHLYVIIAVALAIPLGVAIIVVMLVALHHRRWHSWRKRATHLSKVALSPPVAVHRHLLLTSQALEQSLNPDDERWELNPAWCVLQQHTY